MLAGVTQPVPCMHTTMPGLFETLYYMFYTSLTLLDLVHLSKPPKHRLGVGVVLLMAYCGLEVRRWVVNNGRRGVHDDGLSTSEVHPTVPGPTGQCREVLFLVSERMKGSMYHEKMKEGEVWRDGG